MLTLGRRVGERVLIGEDCWLTVLCVKGQVVRLGFEAPPSVLIRREEIIGKLQDKGDCHAEGS